VPRTPEASSRTLALPHVDTLAASAPAAPVVIALVFLKLERSIVAAMVIALVRVEVVQDMRSVFLIHGADRDG
jgi:hypothetical protein